MFHINHKLSIASFNKLDIDSPTVNSVVYRAMHNGWATSITDKDDKSLRWIDLVDGNIYENQTELMRQALSNKIDKLPENKVNNSPMLYDVNVEFTIFLWAALYRREQKAYDNLHTPVSDDEFLFLILKK